MTLWVTVILVAIPFAMNWGNGMAQFGMRYSMDFTPFLMLLVAFGMKKMDSIRKIAILASVLLMSWGVLYWTLVSSK